MDAALMKRLKDPEEKSRRLKQMCTQERQKAKIVPEAFCFYPIYGPSSLRIFSLALIISFN